MASIHKVIPGDSDLYRIEKGCGIHLIIPEVPMRDYDGW
jgi:hypothetical protein